MTSLSRRTSLSRGHERVFGAVFTFMSLLSAGCANDEEPDVDMNTPPVTTGDGGQAFDSGLSVDAFFPPAQTPTIPIVDGGFAIVDSGFPIPDSGFPTPTPTPSMPLPPGTSSPPSDKLPAVKGTCPDLKTGTVSVSGSRVKLWVGPAAKPGPLVFYFHGTGTTADEVQQGVPGAVAEITQNGGIVASWDATNSQGTSTGNVWTVWFTGDFDAADQLLACGLQQGLVDPSRVHVAGYSAGGLQTGAMLFMRSNYIASGVVYSGGKGFGAMGFQFPGNVPNAVMAHGAAGSDALILDFNEWSTNLGTELKTAGAFVVDCNDGGGHVSATRLGIMGKAWSFMKDHPYNKRPSPYSGGLVGWPSFCKIW